MKKSILVVLLAVLAIMVWTVLVTAKATDKEKLQQPTEIQKAEPGPEAFPEVVLPKQHVARPTQEDFKKEVMDAKGWTPEKVEAIKNAPSVRAEEETLSEKELTYCRMSGNLTEIYFHFTHGSPYLACWGQVGIATLINMDVNPSFGVCRYPHYPFTPAKVRLRIWQPAPCTLYCEARIYGVDYSGGAYPSGELCTSDQANPRIFYHAGGVNNIDVTLLDTTNCCIYGPFFAVFVIDNTDEFLDVDYCPDAPYLPGSFIYDITGLTNNSFWNPYGLGGSWYDVVTYGIANGPIYIQVFGYTQPENTCPPPVDPWYFTTAYPPLAPCGMPDFNQYQMPGPAFCGPTAGADNIWWFAAQGVLPANPPDVPTLINQVAAASQTDPVLGTQCDLLGAGILNVIKSYGGWWFTEENQYAPDFWYLQKEMRANKDVILLLGFWQENPPGSGNWQRFGGHFVTLSGVDIFNLAFAFSDPAMDAAEFGIGPGTVCGVQNPANDPVDHNGGQTSYDYYFAAWPSASPGGLLWLPDYVADWPMFQGQNFRPEHLSYQGPYLTGNPVHVEIEQSIVFWPGQKYMLGEIDGSSSTELNNNHGGIEDFVVDFGTWFQSGLYYGTFIAGTSQADLNCDYGDYFPGMSFDPLGPPDVQSFVVTGSAGDYTVYQLTNHFAHKYLTGLLLDEYAFGVIVPDGGTADCEYAIEDIFALHNTGTDIIGLETGMWLDFDVSEGGTGDLAGYDQQHQSVWMYDNTVPNAVFGFTKKPQIAGDVAISGYGLSESLRVYDGQYVDSLKYWMDNLGWGIDNPTTAEDKSVFIAGNSFDLLAGGIRVEKWLKWGYTSAGDAAWKKFLYSILHQEGFYRGDVNNDGRPTVSDVVYMINYLFKDGPKPIEFEDQADVTNDKIVTVSDVVYMINFLFKGGPAPIDRNRWLDKSPFVDPAYKASAVRNPGLFGDPDWVTLGN